MKRNLWFGLVILMRGSLALLALVGAANAQGGKPPDKNISIQPLAPTAGSGSHQLLGMQTI